jgi:hypothetical protein
MPFHYIYPCAMFSPWLPVGLLLLLWLMHLATRDPQPAAHREAAER